LSSKSPKIRNEIDLDKKYKGNKSWEETIEKEMKQFTDYQTFIILDSVENIPIGNQIILFHMVSDAKYDLSHKPRLNAGVRIGFFSGDLYGHSYCACDI
jgi:hypothetical protein